MNQWTDAADVQRRQQGPNALGDHGKDHQHNRAPPEAETEVINMQHHRNPHHDNAREHYP